jgi:hypothetical protein
MSIHNLSYIIREAGRVGAKLFIENRHDIVGEIEWIIMQKIGAFFSWLV